MIRKKQSIQPVNSLIGKVLKDPLFATAKMDALIGANWSRVLGEPLSKRITFNGLKDATILVSSTSGTGRNDFSFRQEEFLSAFRTLVYPREIKDFRFY